MEIKAFNIEQDHIEIKGEILKAFELALSSGEYILGQRVRGFEEAYAKYIGTRYAIGVGSGTDALRIGGLAAGLKPGDKIVTTPNTYISTVMSLTIHGIIPVFCDIEPGTYNMDPKRLEDIIKQDKDIRLCIPVHLYGQPCRMDEILDVCRRYNVMVMEDACQAHGALYQDRVVGALGDLAVFSFYPTKNLGCYGDGGIIVTDSEEIFKKAVMLRSYGQEAKHIHVTEGFNSRLDEVQAAILEVKLKYLDNWNKKRRHLAWLYRRELLDAPVVLPTDAPWAYHVYHLFVIRARQRDELMRYLAERGVTTLIHYPIPIHLQEVYEHLCYRQGAFPEAEAATREILSLPMYPSLREDEVLYISAQIRAFYGL